MSSLLPVLQSNHPDMSFCSFCPKPGSCCSNFGLWERGFEKTFWGLTPLQDAKKFLQEKEVPFEPLKIRSWFRTKRGYIYVTLLYGCPKLDAAGRCSIYPERPWACRVFVPATDPICVFHKILGRNQR